MRDWTKPVVLNFARPLDGADKLGVFFGHYDCRVYLTDTGYIDIGAGSLMAIKRVTSVPPSASGLIGTIGRFCEINGNAWVHYNGEHDHDQPVNVTMSVLAMMDGQAPDGSLLPGRPFKIGSGVVISSGAEVLAGVTIGDGAVIGAGAVVTKDVGAFEIVAGVPARTIRKRPEAMPWWDLSTRYIQDNFKNLNEVVRSDGQHEWRTPRPPFVFRAERGCYELRGFLDGEMVRSISDAPGGVQGYVNHALTEGLTPFWVADCWDLTLD